MDSEKDISLLPEEMRKKEEKVLKSGKEEEEKIKLYIPPEEEKESAKWAKPLERKKRAFSLWQKIVSTKEERKEKKLEKERRAIEKLKEKQQKMEKEKRQKEEREREKQKKLLEKRGERERRKKTEKREQKIKEAESEGRENRVPREEGQEKRGDAAISPPPKIPVAKEKKPKIFQKEHKAAEVEPGITVSLIPEEFSNPPELRFNRSLLVFIFSVLLTVLAVGAVYLWMIWQESKVTSRTFNIDDEIASVDKQINNYEDIKEEAQELQQRVELVKGLLDKHAYWTKFFDFLERNTVEGVYYSAIAANREGGIVLSAAANNYISIARQLAAFKEVNGLVVGAVVNSAVAQRGEKGMILGVNFNIDLKLAESIFTK